MRFEEISSKEDFDEFFFHEKDFGYIDEETFWVDETHKAKYYFVDELNYSTAYQLYRKKKGFEMTPYYMFVDNDFSIYYIFSEYHTPFKFVYDKSRRERDFTKKSRLQLLNALKYEDKDYNDSFQALFDTKPLVKKFYEEYRVIKTKLSDSLKGITKEDKWFYSQVLLDRIIFIYFLQSRGIIKKEYLTNLFKNRDKKKNFYKYYLKPLFFNAFNFDHPFHEKVEVSGVDLGHIPYLNGGLFRTKDVEINNEINVKDSIWGEIFNLFDSYEWVVEEQKEDAVVLTPSILGHIFEQSVTGRKGKGAYYTPSEITEYLSMNTIYPYLRDKLNERFGTSYKNIIFDLLDKDTLTKSEIDHVAYLYFNLLKELRVLDNACGSGAFLMAAHRILLALYKKCYRILKSELVFSAEAKEIERYGSSDYYFKRVIATHNIYGVDLEEGAVEIAKLRLWLSMISELGIESVEPLPNIDYNIMNGNSLIGFVEAPLVEQTTLDSSDTTMQIIKAKGVLLNGYKATTDPVEAEKLKGNIEKINEKFRPELNEKFYTTLTVERKIDISKEELESLHPFHWGFEFYDVFDPKKPKEERGFDVVIGNPPYVRSIRLKEAEPISWDYFRNVYNTASYGEFDIYLPFLERSSGILSKFGRLGFILPNKWLHARMGLKAREFFLDKKIISEIMNFKSLQVFQGVTNYTILLFLNNTVNNSFFVRQYGGNSEERIETVMADLKSPHYWERGRIKYSNLTSEPWTFSLGEKGKIIDKLKGMPHKLGDYFRVFKGTGTDADPVFFVKKLSEDKNTFTVYSRLTEREHIIEKEIAKPSLKGMDISNYEVAEKDNLLIFPYDEKELILEKEMKERYPLTWEYLNQEECRTKLKKREGGKWKDNNWHRYSYPRGHQYLADNKIIIPAIVNFAEAAYDDVGYHVIDSVYGLRKLSEIDLDDRFILAILNSRLLTFFLIETGTDLRGGYFTMKSAYIEPFPIPDLTKPNKSEGSIYSKIIENVKEIVRLNDTSPEESVGRIQELDDEINKELYGLYRLGNEEAAIVEETVKGRCLRDWIGRRE